MPVAKLEHRVSVAAKLVRLVPGNENDTPGIDPSYMSLLMSVLPPHSKIVGITNDGNKGLYDQFTILIDNPTFREGGVITENYIREVGFLDLRKPIHGQTIIQFNNFAGLDLKDAMYNPGEDKK